MQFIHTNLTNKKIFTQDDFVSFTKLLLTAPIFTVKNVDKQVINEKAIYNGFEVSFYSMPLNMTLDFDVVLFLVKKRFEDQNYVVNCSLTDFYNFVNPEKTDMNNRNNAYKARIEESLKRVKSINITLKNGTKTIICSMIDNAYIDYETNQIYIEFNKCFDNFFSVDRNAIYNINRETLREVNEKAGVYGKILYLYYLCNNANKEKNVVSVSDLKDRFLFSAKEDKKFIMKLRDANKIMKDMGVLLLNKEVKDSRKRTTGFEVLIDTKFRPERSKPKYLPEVKEKEEPKKDTFSEEYEKFLKNSGRN